MTRRRIVMFNQVSADGYFADANGGLDWVVSDPEIHARAVQDMPETDTLLLGRKTYEMFAAFWPGALRNLNEAGPHGADKRDPTFAAMARWLNDTHKLVVSRTLKEATWTHSELVRNLDPPHVQVLKQSAGKNLLIFGSGSLVSQLSELAAIDEYRLVVCPVLLGQGRSLGRDAQEADPRAGRSPAVSERQRDAHLPPATVGACPSTSTSFGTNQGAWSRR